MAKKARGFSWLCVSARILAGLFLGLAIVACQGKGSVFNFKAFKERATETPPPQDQTVEKTFFVDANGKPKTFLCGWAPEVEIGEVGEWIFGHLDHASPHCNLEFEIRENVLIGRLVNPSFPNDRKKWKEYLEIPIVSHFYLEPAKDGYGRETHEWIENSQRSHWTARPMMKLELSGIRFHENGMLWGGIAKSLTHSSVSDIEWDKKSGFVGFTLNMRLSGMFGWSNADTEAQAKVRVNFLEFQHDPSFQKTPYHPENSRLMNVLHVMGRRHDLESEMYAAHWDFRKPVKFYINGTQNQLDQELMILAVEKWNQILAEEGIVPKGQKAFEPVVQNRKHAFDLRYPGLNWIADRRVSYHNSLGVGHAHADVRNGKILWGSVSLFGGILERLVQIYSPNDDTGLGDRAALAVVSAKGLGIPARLELPKALLDLGFSQRSEIKKFFSERAQQLAVEERNRLTKELNSLKGKAGEREVLEQKIQSLTQQIATVSNERHSAVLSAALLKAAQELRGESEAQFATRPLTTRLGMRDQDRPAKIIGLSAEDQAEVREAVRSSKTDAERQKRLRKVLPVSTSVFPDQDLTANAVKATMSRSPVQGKRSFKEMYEGVVMKLALHEIGHVLGLGHNFKENLLPDDGTVPSRIQAELKSVANDEYQHTNLTSIMGYLSGRTWVALDGRKLMPGAHDRLVVRYLYRSEYSGFDSAKDQFVFFKVPEHGRIPDETSAAGQRIPTRYFAQCNDIEASYFADPFCNRWDRGHTAEQIVKSYFEDLSDNLATELYSFVGGRRRDPEMAEMGILARAFMVMPRVRLFYDELRSRLASDRQLMPIWDRIRGDQESLYEFSSACRANDTKDVHSEALKELLFGLGRKSDELRDLCRASLLAFNEMSFLLTLPESDYTRIDRKERYIMGGYLVGDAERDDRQIFGKWYQLANLPLKIASLYTLTRPYSYIVPGWANPFYYMEGQTPLYRTLFPREYTRLISEMVKSNMRFKSLDEDADRTNLGHTLLYSSWMVPSQNYQSSDAGLLPSDFNRVLRNQTEFQFSLAAVLITANQAQSDSKTKANYYKRFTGTVYDMMLDKARTAREVFVLPKGSVLVRVNDMFLVPITQLRFLSDTEAYIIAIKIDYDYEVGDRLTEESVKFILTELHERVNGTCIDGLDGMGLSSYFSSSNEEFEGIYIPPGIATESGKEKSTLFINSIDQEFAKFEKRLATKSGASRSGKTMKVVCDEALRGVGQISSAAALLNGWWLPITNDFIK